MAGKNEKNISPQRAQRTQRNIIYAKIKNPKSLKEKIPSGVYFF